MPWTGRYFSGVNEHWNVQQFMLPIVLGSNFRISLCDCMIPLLWYDGYAGCQAAWLWLWHCWFHGSNAALSQAYAWSLLALFAFKVVMISHGRECMIVIPVRWKHGSNAFCALASRLSLVSGVGHLSELLCLWVPCLSWLALMCHAELGWLSDCGIFLMIMSW